MNPITMLKDDHQKVSRLFQEHERAAPDRKRAIFERINTELSVHAEIEEQVFYPAVREASKKGEETVKEGYEEHAEVKALLAELAAMDAEDREYEAKIAELRQGVEHHVEEEEGEMLPEAERALGGRLQDVGERMREMKQSLMGGALGAAKAVRGGSRARSSSGGSRSRASSGGSRSRASSTGSRSRSSSAGSRSRSSSGGSRSGASRSGSRTASSRGGSSRARPRSTGSRSAGSRGSTSRRSGSARGSSARKTSARTGGRSSSSRSKGSRGTARGGSRGGSRSGGRR